MKRPIRTVLWIGTVLLIILVTLGVFREYRQLEAQRNLALVERDAALGERDTALVERDTALSTYKAFAEENSCPFTEIELDLSKGAEDPVASPFNTAVWTKKNGLDAKNISRDQIGTDPQFLLGYPERMSVRRDQPIVLAYAQGLWGEGNHVAKVTLVNALQDSIVRQIVLDSTAAPLAPSLCAAWYNGGCQFERKLHIDIADLEPGPYFAFLTDDLGRDSHPIFFNVAPHATDMAAAKIVFVYPEFTWAAYNRFGGGSLYTMFRQDGSGRLRNYEFSESRTYSASLSRPMLVDPTGTRNQWTYQEALELFSAPENERFSVALDTAQIPVSKDVFIPNRPPYEFIPNRPPYEFIPNRPPYEPTLIPYWVQRFDQAPSSIIPMMQAARDAEHTIAAVTQFDINENPDLLSNAQTVVFSGHHEYWTRAEYDTMSQYVKDGGTIANFAGNVLWGQVNLNGSDIYFDQVDGIRGTGVNCRSTIPDLFHDTGFMGFSQFPGPERLLGVAYRFGGYPVHEYYWLQRQGYEKYGIGSEELEKASGAFVQAPQHPIFAGTKLAKGEHWGKETPLISLELDALPLNADGTPDDRFSNDIPSDLTVLADAYMFSATRVWDQEVKEDWYGFKKPAVFVDLKPFNNDGSGRVVSLGSIGYSMAVALDVAHAKTIFLNTLEYLGR